MITVEDFTRVNNDVNGNPRYVLHFLNMYKEICSVPNKYQKAVKQANKFGGRKYHTKSYGGGIVFQSYNLQNLCDTLNDNLL